MAQVPAPPKAHRLGTLVRAAFLGPARTAQREGLSSSEQAALALRQLPWQPVENPAVTFLIPLVGKHQIGTWETVETRLAATLRSLIAQTDPNWRCLISGQDRPDTLPEDARITFLPFAEPVEGNDKWTKLKLLTQALPEHGAGPGYAMSFDADDLLHPKAIAEIRRAKAPGALVTQGLIADLGRRKLALAGPRSLSAPLRKPFWKLCGSCSAFAWDGSAENLDFLVKATQHEHRMFPYLAALSGRPLRPLSFPAALYMLNHGENFGPRRGRQSFKARFVDRFELKDQTAALPFGLTL